MNKLEYYCYNKPSEFSHYTDQDLNSNKNKSLNKKEPTSIRFLQRKSERRNNYNKPKVLVKK